MLAALVDQLAGVARRHPIVVACTAGVELGDVAWLAARARVDRGLTIYDSVT
jgi:acetyltransferase-like isoleucine patch superfamily enzyme